jgi:glycerol-1-phosphate dehydrogenase [NAD(P)+]
MKIWNLPRITLMPFEAIEDPRPALVITSGPAWSAAGSRLRLNLRARVETRGATLEDWERVVDEGARGAAVVYVVGGGLAADTAKFLASRWNLPLVALPTALSVDAFLTFASGVRRAGCVEYIETCPPDELVVDFDVIAAAPASIRAAGITDVLSIATGAWDWLFAHSAGRNPPEMAFTPWAHAAALDILEGALDCAESAGRGEREGLKTLLDCLCMEVQLCNQLGHSRPEEGSEHYFAYAAEAALGPGLPHGDLVGPGILLAAERQGLETRRLREALQACHIPLEGIPRETVRRVLDDLPAYCRTHRLPYGIAWEPWP